MSIFTDWGFDSQRSAGNLLAGGLVAGFNPAMGSYLSNYESRMAQEAATEQQHKWNVEENEKDRLWQEKMFGLSNEEWRRRFEFENDFSAQAARLRAAGINPSAFFANGNGGVSSPGAPSYSAGTHALSSYGFSGANGINGSSIFSTIAQLIDSYSNFRTTNLAEERQKATLGAEVDKIMSEAASNYSSSVLNDTLASIKQAYGMSREGAALMKDIYDGYKAFAEGDYSLAASYNQKALARLNTAEAKYKEESMPGLLENIRKLGKVYDTEQEKNVAQASEARAAAKRNVSQASFYDALSDTENQLREGRVTSQELSNKLADVSYQLSSRQNLRDKITSAQQVQAIIDECESKGLINRQLREQIHGQIIDNNWKGVEKSISAISQALGSVASVGNMAITETTTAQRLEIQRRIAENLRRPTSVRTETSKSGRSTFTQTDYDY